MLKSSIITCLLLFSGFTYAHAGSHGNDECIINVDNIEFRLNGYQFQGKHPERHYCRLYPDSGPTIIKIDSINHDLDGIGIELTLSKLDSLVDLVFYPDNAFSIIEQQPIQYFSRQVVSINSDIPSLGIYALGLRVHKTNSVITEQQFIFLAGFPFAKFMVNIAGFILLLILLIFFVQLRAQRRKKQDASV